MHIINFQHKRYFYWREYWSHTRTWIFIIENLVSKSLPWPMWKGVQIHVDKYLITISSKKNESSDLFPWYKYLHHGQFKLLISFCGEQSWEDVCDLALMSWYETPLVHYWLFSFFSSCLFAYFAIFKLEILKGSC